LYLLTNVSNKNQTSKFSYSFYNCPIKLFSSSHFIRKIAFKRSAMQGLRIFVGVVPITILAGFIEGYITRHTEWPFFVRGLIIFLSLCFILFYYIYLPYKRNVYDKRQKKD